MLNLGSRVVEKTTREGLTGTDLITAFIARRLLPLQHQTHIIGQMAGLQDPNRISSRRSKAGLKEEWQFGKPPYSHGNPAPAVSPWSSYFAASHLLLRPDAIRGVLLNAIRHPYDGATTQVGVAQ